MTASQENRKAGYYVADCYTLKGWKAVIVYWKPNCPCACGRTYGACSMHGAICYPPDTHRYVRPASAQEIEKGEAHCGHVQIDPECKAFPCRYARAGIAA